MESKLPKTERQSVYSKEENQKLGDKINNFLSRLASDPSRTKLLMRAYDEFTEFSEHLKEKYDGKENPKYNAYAMWHFLGGSSIDPKLESEIRFDDFPGEDSTKAFIDSFVDKYEGFMI